MNSVAAYLRHRPPARRRGRSCPSSSCPSSSWGLPLPQPPPVQAQPGLRKRRHGMGNWRSRIEHSPYQWGYGHTEYLIMAVSNVAPRTCEVPGCDVGKDARGCVLVSFKAALVLSFHSSPSPALPYHTPPHQLQWFFTPSLWTHRRRPPPEQRRGCPCPCLPSSSCRPSSSWERLPLAPPPRRQRPQTLRSAISSGGR